MIFNVISEDREVFDKKRIVPAIRNSTFGDELSYSLINDVILNKCEGCSLKYIYDEIDKVSEDYINKTTKVVNSFSFE